MSIARAEDDGRLMWFTSTYSNGAGGECVECAPIDGHALIRDSKSGQGPVVAMPSHSWRFFIQALKQGELS
ncbi:DUF397 domain-containing protein [Streptomyces sp. NBC_00847]|uniref:DUF397 domain-containing protein n=1 Tax=unclassified Streptomyces TaxID=2593676 RepID=UPI0022503C7D|nr:DUF397 domain-containing protein [Streptomyces sp. NBC_00847]MCX4881057.1 DUF397 domain-containing protein [Streptomyces sp. NBC_00847]